MSNEVYLLHANNYEDGVAEVKLLDQDLNVFRGGLFPKSPQVEFFAKLFDFEKLEDFPKIPDSKYVSNEKVALYRANPVFDSQGNHIDYEAFKEFNLKAFVGFKSVHAQLDPEFAYKYRGDGQMEPSTVGYLTRPTFSETDEG